MASGISKLWITPKLPREEATIILACLSEVNITDARRQQLALFGDLSRQFERRWPDDYKRLVEQGVFPDWRQWAVDRMTDEELRQAALQTVAA